MSTGAEQTDQGPPADPAVPPEPRAPLPPAVTIYDVARAAGVSASTVSRTFARPGRVSAATAERIRAIAADLGYRSDPVRSAPLRQSSRVVGLLVSDVTNPFYFSMIRGAERAAASLDHSILLIDAQESDEAERTGLRRSLGHVDALVLGSSRLSDTDVRMLAKQRPVVVVNRNVAGLPCILSDNARGMRRAVEHLASLGHTTIHYLAGPEASWSDGTRWRALREGCYELGLADRRHGPYAPTPGGGAAGADAVLRSRATAVIAYNDLMAIGLLNELAARGVRVPEEVSIVGFDNSFGSDLVRPALTTVESPVAHIGQVAVKNAIALAGGATWQLAEPISAAMRLVVRQSSGPAPA